MITPAYSPTATERVLPRLALDFTTGALDARVAVTRALNTATAVNSSGYVAIVNADLPRFDYDPVTLACKGLLIEEARTNLTPYSADYSTWGNVFAGLTTGQGPAPDGQNNATKIVPNNGQASSWISQVGIPASTGTYTLSVYAKAAGLTEFQIGFFNTTDGDKVGKYTLSGSGAVSGSSAGTTPSIQNAGNGWYRCVLTFTTTGTGSTQIQIARLPSGTGDGVNGWLVWGAQLEAGAFATSYIPTTTTSLTRNADVVSMTGTNFSDWYNASAGTFQVELLSPPAASSIVIAASRSALGASLNDSVSMDVASSSVRGIVRDGAAVQCVLGLGTQPTAGSTFKATIAYANNNFGGALNGGATATDITGTVPSNSPDQLVIGNFYNIIPINSHFRRVEFWPQRLTNAELQAFSK